MPRKSFIGLAILAMLAGSYLYIGPSRPMVIAGTTLTYLLADLAGKDDTNLMLGSSSVQRLEPSVYLACGSWSNRGIGASTIPDIERYLTFRPSGMDPANIVLYAGENDIHQKGHKDTTLTSYIRLLDKISTRFPNSLVHIMAIKPSLARENSWAYFKTMNSTLKSYSQSKTHLIFHEPEWVELYGTNVNRENQPWFLSDNVHLTDAGYRAFAKPINSSCIDA